MVPGDLTLSLIPGSCLAVILTGAGVGEKWSDRDQGENLSCVSRREAKCLWNTTLSRWFQMCRSYSKFSGVSIVLKVTLRANLSVGMALLHNLVLKMTINLCHVPLQTGGLREIKWESKIHIKSFDFRAHALNLHFWICFALFTSLWNGREMVLIGKGFDILTKLNLNDRDCTVLMCCCCRWMWQYCFLVWICFV